MTPETKMAELDSSHREQLAKAFATDCHASVDQRRKYTGEPYIVHPTAVVALVKSVPHTIEMVLAAWLHDTVEDTSATIEEIRAMFGEDVAQLVEMLTDVSKPSDGNRAIRKEIDRQHTASASSQAKTIKLADLIDNTGSIVTRDPEFAKIYMAEKELLLECLTEGDPALFKLASSMLTEYQRSKIAILE